MFRSQRLAGKPRRRMERIGFGGGCHWCTEAVFQSLRGVALVEQGWIAAPAPDDTFSEAVLVDFAREAIGLDTLIEIHLRTHASTSDHALRGKYRSAVYVFSDGQRSDAAGSLERLQEQFDDPLVTRILDFREFKSSDERFRNYYADNPERPFCRRYIDPKLRLLRERFARSVLPRSRSVSACPDCG